MSLDPVHADDASRWTAHLLDRGYCIIPSLLDPAHIAALDADLADRFQLTPFCEGHFYGPTTKRFGRLLARSPRMAALIEHPLVFDIVSRVLSPWCDRIQLNVAQAIAVHPGSPQQLPHRDDEMWAGPKGAFEYLVNVIWPLTAFTADNGATIVWPGSHGRSDRDADPVGSPIAAEMEPGAALVFLGSTLHGAGANVADHVRRGIVVGYSLGWLRAYENQSLAYPPEVARSFPPAIAALVGYAQHRPNLGNYEGQCPSVLLRDAVPDALAAIDALRPDQQRMIETFASTRMSR